MPARRASLTRNTLARYAPVATKRAPVTNESRLTQLLTLSPAALPTGTRPPAIAPTTVPRKNGVSTDDAPNTVVESARPRARRAVCWNAKPAPRRTIPNAARLSGMNSVEKMASKADGKPVHRTTSTKISQTWFASHTGPIAQSISARGRRPRSPPPASRLQKPAPKSAPPKTAYIVTPTTRMTATAFARVIAALPVRQRRRARVGAVWHFLVAVLVAPATRHRAQGDDQRRAERDVEGEHERERDPDAVGVGDRVGGAHDVVDDPRLAADLRDDPAALERDDRGHAGERDRAQEPLRLRDVTSPPPGEPEPGAEADQHRADADHRVEGPVQHRVVGRPVVGRHRVQSRSPACSCSSRPGTSRSPGCRGLP